MRNHIFNVSFVLILIISIFAGCYKLLPPPDLPDVIGNLPIISNNISPENNSTVYGQEVDLEWYVSDKDNYIESIDLYFGKQPDPTLHVTNVHNLDYDEYRVDGLEPNSTYYWKIVVKDEFNEVQSPIWSFKTTYIGRELFGGIVFYVDETGEHGLVCSKENLEYSYYSTFDWGESNQNYNAFGDGIGAGIQNTQNIVDSYAGTDMIAAQLCYDLYLNAYSDWYLPSLTELNYIYENLKKNGLGSGLYNYIWSSTEDGLNYAKAVDFDDGTVDNVSKTNSCKVRAVREF